MAMTNQNSKIQNPYSFILSIASGPQLHSTLLSHHISAPHHHATTHNHAFRHCFTTTTTTTTTKAPPSPLSTSINLTTAPLIIVILNVTTSLPSSTPARIIGRLNLKSFGEEREAEV
ncbi:hypothetical protein RND81_05G029700 [Saponaria officinalis]|uniref:Uncharacterized protein n=1 Tax=Saponaria officinalis TaxID=3572 RepID=A0AAW1KS70_SAPOF